MSRGDHRTGVYGLLARSLANRCAELEVTGLAPNAAERVAFEEALTQHGSLPPETYEAFVAAHAPARRRQHGVYNTPAAVVEAQVRLAAEALRRLGCTNAFDDPRVLVVDPATGSGAYPLEVIRQCGKQPRMLLFEALPGPAVVARGMGLEVLEQDALETNHLPASPIVVCVGNPPYRRRRATRLLGELIGRDGIHAKSLHNDYVYFWLWALETVFKKRPGPGIVSFVTASSYLRGPAFTAFRERLRRVLDELWIVDLEGDQRAARRTRNVFPIRTPVAIAMGARYAQPGLHPAPVHYVRLLGDRVAKLEALSKLSLASPAWVDLDAPGSAPLIANRRGAYTTWPLLTDLFPWQTSGVQMKRTWPIAPTREVLRARWASLLRSADRELTFGPTRDRTTRSTPLHAGHRLEALANLPIDSDPIEPVPYAYRSFDRQWLLCDPRLGDYLRPSLWRVAGPGQVFLTSLLTNVLGPGPAAVATALVPDMDCFRGSYGARAVIPLWRDAAGTQPNVADDILEQLGVAPDTLLAYCYALLGTRGYVLRFEDELRTPGPRIPLTRDADVFQRAAGLGQELLDLHTYRRILPGAARVINLIGDEPPAALAFDGETLHVGQGAVAPVSPAVWAYSVSGMPVVRSWLRRRIKPRQGKSPLDAITLERWTPRLTNELLELLWLLEATLRLEPLLDALLDAAISSSRDRGVDLGGRRPDDLGHVLGLYG